MNRKANYITDEKLVKDFWYDVLIKQLMTGEFGKVHSRNIVEKNNLGQWKKNR